LREDQQYLALAVPPPPANEANWGDVCSPSALIPGSADRVAAY
jgi:hypothetical protein